MEALQEGVISRAAGLEGDFKGAKHPHRQITVLAREDWEAALADLPPGTPEALRASPWTARRANILVEGVRLPRAAGGVLRVGPVELEITGETSPCRRMEEVAPGLIKALAPQWRGGVTCRVLSDGRVRAGDPVTVLHAPEERTRRLPG